MYISFLKRLMPFGKYSTESSFLKKHTYFKVQLLCVNSCFFDEKEFSFEAMVGIQGALLEILLAVASSYYGLPSIPGA